MYMWPLAHAWYSLSRIRPRTFTPTPTPTPPPTPSPTPTHARTRTHTHAHTHTRTHAHTHAHAHAHKRRQQTSPPLVRKRVCVLPATAFVTRTPSSVLTAVGAPVSTRAQMPAQTFTHG